MPFWITLSIHAVILILWRYTVLYLIEVSPWESFEDTWGDAGLPEVPFLDEDPLRMFSALRLNRLPDGSPAGIKIKNSQSWKLFNPQGKSVTNGVETLPYVIFLSNRKFNFFEMMISATHHHGLCFAQCNSYKNILSEVLGDPTMGMKTA